MASGSKKRVMAVASGGGHWIQLMRLLPALQGNELCFVSTDPSVADSVPGSRFRTAVDANRATLFKMAWLVIQMGFHVLCFRPDVVVTTGAAPGFWACRFGRMVGARTLWIDSVANAGELSMSGRKAGKFVDLWLTQWEHLAGPDGPEYRGSSL